MKGVRHTAGPEGAYMLKKVILIAGIAGALGFIAAPANAAVTACYDVYINANGTVVEQADCVEA